MGAPSYKEDIEERRFEDLRRAREDLLSVGLPRRQAGTSLPRWKIKQINDAAREEARKRQWAIGNALWFEVARGVEPLRRR